MVDNYLRCFRRFKVIFILIISYSKRILKVFIKEDYIIKSLLTVLGVLATLRSVSNLELVDGGCLCQNKVFHIRYLLEQQHKVNISSSTVNLFAVVAVDFTDGTSLEKSGNSEKSEKLLRRGFKNWEERY